MKDAITSYTINEIEIPWGKSFHEVVPLLSHFEQFQAYASGWANMHVKGTNIFGLHCPVIEVRAPFGDRPVLQVIYQLAPIAQQQETDLHSRYMHVLRQQLGEPLKQASYYDHNDWRKGLSQYAVAYTATWEFGATRISLSVYGGNRTHASGTHAAALYVNWIDEKAAAANHLPPLDELRQRVADYSAGDFIAHRVTIAHPKQPTYLRHYENKNPEEALHDEQLRMAQLALYYQNLFVSPTALRNKLGANEVCTFRIPGVNKTFLANQWEVVFLNDDDSDVPVFSEIFPARGPGGRAFGMKNWEVGDRRESNALLDLLQYVERLSGKTTLMREYTDD